MDKELQKILESNVLSDEVREAIVSAMKAKIDESSQKAREEIEAALREEYAARYQAGKRELEEATALMVESSIQALAAETNERVAALQAEKDSLQESVTAARKQLAEETKSVTKAAEKFIAETVAAELREFAKDRRAVLRKKISLTESIDGLRQNGSKAFAQHARQLQEKFADLARSEITELSKARVSLSAKMKQLDEERKAERKAAMEAVNTAVIALRRQAMQALYEERQKLRSERMRYEAARTNSIREMAEYRKTMTSAYHEKMQTLDSFVTEQVTRELKEFQKDRAALAEDRVRLHEDAKRVLAETRRDFINKTADIVNKFVTETVKNELSEMRTDINEARKNHFGRKLYEAFSAEFSASHYTADGEMLKATRIIESREKELNDLKRLLAEQSQALDSAKRKVRLTEERATRVEDMARLCSNLDTAKRREMEKLLESVRTSDLAAAYQKYLPHVMGSSTHTPAANRQTSLMEASRPVRAAAPITGDKVNTAVREQDAEVTDGNTYDLRRLAGIN